LPPWQCMPRQLRPLAKCPTKVVAVLAAHKRVDKLAALLKGKWVAWAALVVAWADPPADKWVVPVVRWVALLKAKWVEWAAPSVGWVVALPAVKRAAWATLVVAWPVLPAGKWAVWADPPVRWAVLPVGKWAA
jgi:hypothetical protein